MKKLIVAFFLIMFPVVKTSACSMPLPAIQQKWQMNQALESKEFSEAMHEVISLDHNARIERVEFDQGIQVVMNNHCTITVKLKYGMPRHPGLCPEYLGAVASVACL